MSALPPLPRKYKAIAVCGVAVLVAVVTTAVYGRRGWMHLRELEGKQRQLEGIAFRLQQENDKRQEHLSRLASDDAYVEKLARERLGWIKPGETVYRVRGVITSPPQAAAKPPAEPPAVNAAPRRAHRAQR
jgi:cell division protein FtsB